MPGELVRRPEVGSLEHYGVPGMKWGQRKLKDYRHTPDTSGVTRSQARGTVKRQKVETRRNLEDFESSPTRSKQIREARGNRRKADRKYEDIKRDLKDQKSTGALGRNAARVALNKAKNERYANAYKANSKTVGEQFIQDLMGISDSITGRYDAGLANVPRMNR